MKAPAILILCAFAALFVGNKLANAQATRSSAWKLPAPVVSSGAGNFKGGTAPIDEALAAIIPPYYRIELAQSVPRTMVLVWPPGSNWMNVLKRAIAPVRLAVEPDWQHNIIRVVRAHRPHSPKRSNSFGHSADDAQKVATRKVAKNVPHDRPDAAVRPATPSTVPPRRVPLNDLSPLPPLDKPVAKTDGEAFTIEAGKSLSQGLAEYVKTFGWQLRWEVKGPGGLKKDYVLDAPLPIPAGSLKHGLTYILNAYQSQGGLLGDTFVRHIPNKIVVAEPTKAKENR